MKKTEQSKKNYMVYGDNLNQNPKAFINATAVYFKSSQGIKDLEEDIKELPEEEHFSSWEIFSQIKEMYTEATEWMDTEAVLFVLDIWNGTWTPANDFVTNLYLLQMK